MGDEFRAVLAALEGGDGRDSERYSEPFTAFLPVTGAAVSTLGDVLGSETISATDSQAARLDEVQFDIGEGPCWDAMRTARPVLEPSLHAHGAARWPAFSAAIRDEPVSSIFAFPLTVGPLRLGAVDLYSREPVTLESDDSQRATLLADVIGRQLLRDALTAAEAPSDIDLNPLSRRVVHQATGVVLAQLAVSPDDALLILQGHAYATERSMVDVAADIVERRLTFRRRDGRIEVGP